MTSFSADTLEFKRPKQNVLAVFKSGSKLIRVKKARPFLAPTETTTQKRQLKLWFFKQGLMEFCAFTARNLRALSSSGWDQIDSHFKPWSMARLQSPSIFSYFYLFNQCPMQVKHM